MTCSSKLKTASLIVWYYSENVDSGLLPLMRDWAKSNGKISFTCHTRVNEIRQLLQNKVNHCYCCLVAKSCPTLLRPHGLQPARLLCSWDFLGKNIWSGLPFLLQGIFLTHVSCKAGRFFTTESPEKPRLINNGH